MSETSNDGTIHLVRQSNAYWRVTFDIPPLNIFGPANIPQLEQVVSSIETDDRVKVVVFDSAVDGFFLTHYDFLASPEDSTQFPAGPTGLPPLPDMFVRLSRADAVSISLIRGRATGVGSELDLKGSQDRRTRHWLNLKLLQSRAASSTMPYEAPRRSQPEERCLS